MGLARGLKRRSWGTAWLQFPKSIGVVILQCCGWRVGSENAERGSPSEDCSESELVLIAMSRHAVCEGTPQLAPETACKKGER